MNFNDIIKKHGEDFFLYITTLLFICQLNVSYLKL